MRSPRTRYSIGAAMEVIAASALLLAIGRDLASTLGDPTFSGRSGPGLETIGMLCLLLLVIPRLVLRIVLWFLPCLSAEADEPL